jgi:ABC-type amino acid transport system permease subunit
MTLLLTFFGLSMGFVIGLVLALVRVYGAEELGWEHTSPRLFEERYSLLTLNNSMLPAQ